jgi:hypothetical protein
MTCLNSKFVDDNPSLLDLLGFGQEEHVRYGWFQRREKRQWVPVGVRNEKVLGTSDGLLDEMASEVCDVFLSPNEFFSWRKKKQVCKLHANYIDIDTVDRSRMLSVDEEDALIDDVFMQLLEADIPYPSGLVRSGSGGIHLYWIYEPVDAYSYRVDVWQAITDKIAAELNGGDVWKVDSVASRDVSRVLRMPGSIHGKSQRRVIDEVIIPELYDFSSLVRHFGLEKAAERPVYKIVERKPREKTDDGVSARRKLNGKHNIKAWWGTTFFHIVKRGRSVGFGEGRRDSAAFMLFVALRHIKDSAEDAYDAVKVLNEEFIHLRENELKAYLQTAMVVKYKYTKEALAKYLADNLGMDPSYLFSTVKVGLSLVERRVRLRFGAKCTAMSKRQGTLARIKMAYSEGVTQQTVSAVVGMSVRTVRRYWSQVKRECIGH